MKADHEAARAHAGTDHDMYLNPVVPPDVGITEVPLVRATAETLRAVGHLVEDPQQFTVENGRFEIVPWPRPGWRPLDPGTGVEGGTTEGQFSLFWEDGRLYGENLALATQANKYVLGLGVLPGSQAPSSGAIDSICAWYSDYHPDGGQLLFSESAPFVANLAPPLGDDVKPADFTAYYFEAGSGVYIHPGVWHNAVYVSPAHSPARVFGRQGRVHARVSIRWVEEFNTVLRVPLSPP